MPTKTPATGPTKHVICIERVGYLSEMYWEMYVQQYRACDYSNPVIIDDYVCDDIKELLQYLKDKMKGIEKDESSVSWF